MVGDLLEVFGRGIDEYLFWTGQAPIGSEMQGASDVDKYIKADGWYTFSNGGGRFVMYYIVDGVIKKQRSGMYEEAPKKTFGRD